MGWADDLTGWPVQCSARVEFEGRSFLLYLHFRGNWKGWIVEGAEKVHDLADRACIWSEELLCGCRVKHVGEAKLALVRIFKRQLGIRRRVILIKPKII